MVLKKTKQETNRKSWKNQAPKFKKRIASEKISTRCGAAAAKFQREGVEKKR